MGSSRFIERLKVQVMEPALKLVDNMEEESVYSRRVVQGLEQLTPAVAGIESRLEEVAAHLKTGSGSEGAKCGELLEEELMVVGEGRVDMLIEGMVKMEGAFTAALEKVTGKLAELEKRMVGREADHHRVAKIETLIREKFGAFGDRLEKLGQQQVENHSVSSLQCPAYEYAVRKYVHGVEPRPR